MVYKTLLADTPENLIKKYYQVLLARGIPVEQIILFGSYAKGNAHAGSDVDIAVVSSVFGKRPFDEMVELSKLTLGIESLIEPHPMHPDDLNDKYDSLATEIRTYGKRII